MSSHPPPKPWERRMSSNIPSFQSSDLGSSLPTRSVQPVVSRIPPPVPTRPSQQSGGSSITRYRPAYNSFSAAYSPYGSSFYGSCSPYGYGYGGLGYNRFRTDDIPPSRFVRQAEESSRGAFESVESIVHAFASVSMMMDATFSAVYNSFRAVLDVANHFSRLKIHFTKVFSAFALVRTLRYLYIRLQRLLGLRKKSETEDLWAESMGAVTSANTEDRASSSGKSWPIFMFFAVVLGGPYLIWKLLCSENESESNASTSWASGEDDHVVGRADYDFCAASDEEISFCTGDVLNLAPKEQQPKIRGWLLASLNEQIGLVPANYIKILGKRKGRRHMDLEKIAEQEHIFMTGPPSTEAKAAVNATEKQEEAFESAFTGAIKR
ncbi:peroxisome biogenesis factor 13 [Protopterus annectens]|uniref:peroxisome biogenesis factor 13 n=1 Tax=Protopterus annectens TaxID=7888 RepID=UPI001CFA23E9|nr:peroxisome biogenesis factor 13 [Protopterus annectens]